MNPAEKIKTMSQTEFNSKMKQMQVGGIFNIGMGICGIVFGALLAMNVVEIDIPIQVIGVLFVGYGSLIYIFGRRVPFDVWLLKFYKDRC